MKTNIVDNVTKCWQTCRTINKSLRECFRPSFVPFYTFSLASITGSAVCAFYMDDIEKAFSGKFKEQRNSESVWTPVPDEQVPKPR